jgi:HD-GYP domain-containing protein (c-di-GMP phosphodiesterase class II)
VLEHHERYDGTGYPEGKKGQAISLGGQIVGLAEAWTALTERRAYRDAMSPAQAMATLVGAADAWFRGDLIAALRASEM